MPVQPVRCSMLFKPNYQCGEQAAWAHPSISEDDTFKWICFCDIHRKHFDEVAGPIMADIMPITDEWIKI